MTTTPAAVVERVGDCLSAGDVEAALALYEPNASFLAHPDQPPVHGTEQIREALTGFAALQPTMDGEIVKVVEADDVALVVNRWTMRGTRPDGEPLEMTGVSADVVRRQDDGSWRVVVDDPWGGGAA